MDEFWGLWVGWPLFLLVINNAIIYMCVRFIGSFYCFQMNWGGKKLVIAMNVLKSCVRSNYPSNRYSMIKE